MSSKDINQKLETLFVDHKEDLLSFEKVAEDEKHGRLPEKDFLAGRMQEYAFRQKPVQQTIFVPPGKRPQNDFHLRGI